MLRRNLEAPPKARSLLRLEQDDRQNQESFSGQVHSLPAHNLGFEQEMTEYLHIKLVLMQTSFFTSSDNQGNSYLQKYD